MKLRKLVSILLVALITLSSVACSDSASTSTSGGDDEFLQRAEAGILRVAGGYEPPETIHGNVWASTNIVQNIGDFTFEKLFDYIPLPEQTYLPVLGESFTEEGNKVTINLREGVVWNDGTPFTSQDVLATFNISFIANGVVWRYLESIEAIDDHTVEFTLRTPNAISTQLIANTLINTPYHIYQEWADEAAIIVENAVVAVDENGTVSYDEATNTAKSELLTSIHEFKPDIYSLVGTGPFKPSNITSSEGVLVQNENYWNPDNIHINEVHIIRTSGVEA